MNSKILITLGVIDLFSIVLMAIFVFEYRHMWHKYESLFKALSDGKTHAHAALYMWTYILGTTVLTFGTTLLYLLHPDWL